MGSTGTQTRRAEPVRTCAGCRTRDAQSALLRFAVRDEAPRLVPDPRRQFPGRGVSVHPRRACIVRAAKGGGFARSLRSQVAVDVEALCALIQSGYSARIEGLLMAALRKRAASLGSDATRAALRDGSARLVVLARDAAGRRGEVVSLAERDGLLVIEHGTKSQLGRLVGRDELGVFAILDERIASELATVVSLAQDLSEAE
ncbi:MAG: DUF448 domain-containing protein [Sandaracinaceae bacterium]|nr:DUF448 domain-containing protein [Sandaracinaceae bacterium]